MTKIAQAGLFSNAVRTAGSNLTRAAALVLLFTSYGADAVTQGAGAGDLPKFRDLNHNGRLDPYEDSRLSPEERADDLLKQMTLEEKTGVMMHGTLPTPGDTLGRSDTGYDLVAVEKLVVGRGINSFITRLSASPATFAAQNNAVQAIAERSRLGIPVTISTDPRNHFRNVVGAGVRANGFSLWPEMLAFGAVGDPALARQFGDAARREYRAVGIQMALSPQADLATEPRWSRIVGTFGSRPELVSSIAGAYIEGFQHGRDGVRADGVATIVKHWVGYGAQPLGYDSHNYYGRYAKHTDKSFAQYVAAFQGAFAAHSAGVMPTYSIITGVSLDGKPLEEVGGGVNRQLLTDLLRGRMHYDGIIVSDWFIVDDCAASCMNPTAELPQQMSDLGMPWGTQGLSKVERMAKGVNAGLDQFGGIDDNAPLLEAVRKGLVTEARIGESVRRVLILKFRQGLFDNPYVDPTAAGQIVGNAATQAQADAAQRRAQVVLENKGQVLPLTATKRKVWLHGLDAATAEGYGFQVVASPADADVAIIRTSTPSEKLHPYNFFGGRQKEGRLDFRDGDVDYEAIKTASKVVPTVVVIDLDRPAILTNVRDKAHAIVATFGASDRAVLDVLTGRALAEGRLPFELPSSMADVEAQEPGMPDDSHHPLYRFGAGIHLELKKTHR